ncbi:Cationic amino acid transporter 1 [Linum perenne]
MRALSNTIPRLKDRFFSRSIDSLELQDVRARSGNELKRTLNWWDLIWFGMGAVMGAGIEFAVELPVAGGSYAYLRVELGDFVAYIAAGNILFEYIVAGASVARSWTSYFATLCNREPNSFRIYVRSMATDYNKLDPIAVGISSLVCVAASWSMKGSSRFNFITTIIHLVVLVFILAAGFTKANTQNISNFAPYGVRGVMKASAMLFFAYVGFDGVATLGEEVKNPGRDIPLGLIGSMTVVIIVYCLLAACLTMMQPYYQIDTNAAFSMAFKAVGMDWAKYIVAFGALKGMTTVLLANIIAQSRYFTHISRTHMAPPILAYINASTGTPLVATVVMTVANSIVAFFTSLDVLSSLLSISTLFIFTLVALGLLVRRYYLTGETKDSDKWKLVFFLVMIVGSSCCSSAYWAYGRGGWIGYVITVPIWFLATLGLQVFVKMARKPKIWGVPFLPWLPSASIAMNVFVMGSIDSASFVRFGLWSLILMVYYLLVALHASYDAAREIERESNGAVRIEEGEQ